jgi:hypothetical protein
MKTDGYHADVLGDRAKPGWGRVFIIVALLLLVLVMFCLSGCAGQGAGTRTTTIAPDGTQTIVEQIDPFMMLQTECLKRRFE